MCGRALLTVSGDDLEQTFGYRVPAGYRPRYNIAPSQPVLVLRDADGARRFDLLSWGLVPSWAKADAPLRPMINARAETIATKPMFRTAFARQRCLVVIDGFYEWQASPGGKRPHLIQFRDRAPFTLAGIWERWEGGEAPLESCAIVTTEASDSISALHDRMPVILPPADRDAWLHPGASRSELESLLRPYRADDLEYYEVSTLVNSPANDRPECLDRVDPPLTLL